MDEGSGVSQGRKGEWEKDREKKRSVKNEEGMENEESEESKGSD